MPTHEETAQFDRDWESLTPDERRQLKVAVNEFAADVSAVPPGRFRPGLRVKPMKGANGIFEMTWEIRDGRATFGYGDEVTVGEIHIIWRRIGSHAIFGNP